MSLDAPDSRGFTLVEVMVALGAMAIAFTALWVLHLSSLSIDMKNHSEIRAVFLANRQLEDLRSAAVLNFAGLADGTSTDNPEGAFTRTWQVTTVETWRKNVTVTVTWPESVRTRGGGKTKLTRSLVLTSTLVDLELF
ncbi:MAG TPA: type II secretion system protein [Syntrophobacteraceae bacterium]|nr:type II secretion system protein [Syntrophobacteraceae bacterium]